jgi:hypothetical protein
MHAALAAVTDLQPDLANPVAFRDPANAKRLDGDLAMLAGLKHHFLGAKKTEPGMETLATLFGQHVERTRFDFKTGNTEAARMRLRSLTSLCFACHTREAVAMDFDDAARRVEKLALPPLREAEFYATTRQFDRAIALWTQVLQGPVKSEGEAFEQAAALREYVAVLVRVRDDRPATEALLQAQVKREGLPPFIARLLTQWLEDARAWKADPFDRATRTPLQLFTKARTLITASGAAQSALTDERRFISLQRAGGYLHAALAADPKATFRGEALYLLGVASAASNDPLLWELDSLYLEGCIRENAHTALARKCADRMYDRAWFSWSGSGGTDIPPDVSQRLGELRVLAQAAK